jgi:hypothetical protein
MHTASVKADVVEEFAYALEYLVRLVGADTPVHLNGIARALHNVSWTLPRLEPVTPEQNIFGFRTCLAERACNFLSATGDFAPLNTRELLEPFPSKPAIRKMCFVHYMARLTPGFRLVAARGNNGTAAYIPNSVITGSTACSLLKNGWRCLHVKG